MKRILNRLRCAWLVLTGQARAVKFVYVGKPKPLPIDEDDWLID